MDLRQGKLFKQTGQVRLRVLNAKPLLKVLFIVMFKQCLENNLYVKMGHIEIHRNAIFQELPKNREMKPGKIDFKF